MVTIRYYQTLVRKFHGRTCIHNAHEVSYSLYSQLIYHEVSNSTFWRSTRAQAWLNQNESSEEEEDDDESVSEMMNRFGEETSTHR